MTLLTLGTVGLETTGELRYLGSLPPAVVVDAEGTPLGQGPVLDQRLRLGLDAKGDSWTIGTAWDLFSGQLAGDPWDIPGTIDARHREDVGVIDAGSFVPRRAATEFRSGPVQVQAGLVTSHWGLGMIANDGAHDPVFGRTDFGDRTFRLRVATRPIQGGEYPFTVAVAADRVIEDELARMADGQVAWQGVAAAIWTPESGDRLGAYVVYRDQAEADGVRFTRVALADLYGELVLPLGAVTVRAGAEAAGVLGRTSRAGSYEAPEGLDVSSAGLTGYAGLGGKDERWGARLRGGWASGDGNPDDGATHDFTFDRDHDVGMLLFDELGGAIEANAYAQLADPENGGGPPDGAEAIVTEGSFRRAAFVQPVLDAAPLPWLGVRAGVLIATATAPIAQPFYTFRKGGTPTSHLDRPTKGTALGTEIDWAVRVGGAEMGPERVRVRPELLVQGAHLLPSEAMGGPGVLTLVTGTARVRW